MKVQTNGRTAPATDRTVAMQINVDADNVALLERLAKIGLERNRFINQCIRQWIADQPGTRKPTPAEMREMRRVIISNKRMFEDLDSQTVKRLHAFADALTKRARAVRTLARWKETKSPA